MDGGGLEHQVRGKKQKQKKKKDRVWVSTQNPEEMSDNGNKDRSRKGGTRRKKGYQRFSFSLGVRRKKKEKANGEKTAKKLWNRKTPKRKKPQLIWTAARRGERRGRYSE